MENESQLTVLVTGFGPFGTHKINASWQAVKLLPELLTKIEESLNINLIIEEISVAYRHVSSRIKELWDKHKPSIIIHVGVSSYAKCLVIERQAISNGYTKLDIFDKCPMEKDSCSITLTTSCNIKKICETVNKNSSETGCTAIISNNAGRYLCEYIYYQSLNLKEPQVLFIHVPNLDIYSSSKTAKGILEILIFLIKNTIEQKVE